MFKLLIVEDEKPIRDKMINNVDWQGNGYQVYQASNGEEAINVLENNEIDIMVTDIQMPKLSGIELVKKVRELSENIKVIIISGYAEFEYAQQSIRLGVDDYLLKPFRSQRLLKVVNKTKKKFLEEKMKRDEIENIRQEIDEYLDKNNLKKTLNWLTNDGFFEKQSFLLDDNRLFRELRTGSKQDLAEEIDKVLQEIENYKSDRQRLLLLINNIVLNTFKTMKELGYDFADLMSIVDSEYFEDMDGMNIEMVKEWLKQFLDDVNQLLIFKKDNRNKDLIRDVKVYINDHFSEGITLNEMARHFNVSTGYLSKLFLEQVGENFTDYLNMIRINKAKELLKTTDKKIYEVADEVGFNDSYYFSSWFKKIVGVTPTTYRDNLDLL